MALRLTDADQDYRSKFLTRFWAKVDIPSGSARTADCWIWNKGSKNRRASPTIFFKTDDVKASRVSFALHYDLTFPLKDDETGSRMNFKCRNNLCVSPHHIEPVNAREHICRGRTSDLNNNGLPRGITFNPERKCYKAQIQLPACSRRVFHLGYFDSQEIAGQIYAEAVRGIETGEYTTKEDLEALRDEWKKYRHTLS